MLLIFLQLIANRRSMWVHPLNNMRFEKGEFYTLYPDLRLYPRHFFKFYRMTIAKFDALFQLVGPRLVRTRNNYRKGLESEQCLVLTIT